MAYIDEFAVELAEGAVMPQPRQTPQIHLYVALIGSAAPLNFPDGSSLRVIDAAGEELFVPFKHFAGSPLAAGKLAQHQVKVLLQEMLSEPSRQEPPLDLWRL